MLKKLFIIFALIVFTCCGCAKKEEVVTNDLDVITNRGRVIIGVKTDTYPFGYKVANGNYKGYDIELAKLIAKNILGDENKVEFVPVTAYDRMMKLDSGDVDMIVATMSVTPSRQRLVNFSIPYHYAGQALLVRKGSKVKHLQDLKGKKAIIVFGSTSEKSLRDTVPNVGIIGYKTYQEAYNALKQGKADAIVADDTILYGFSYKDKNVVLLPKRYSKEPYAVAFRKSKGSAQLINEVDNIIEIETRNGNLKKLKNKYGIK